MRQLLATVVMGLAVPFLNAAKDDSVKVEVKGPHICCKQCVKVVGNILGKVEGVADVKSDVATKTITFSAKNAAVAKAGVKALFDGGFFGKASADDKAVTIAVAAGKKGDKVGKIAVKDVHVCCGACQSAINKVFGDAKVSYTGKGPQRTVILEQADSLEAAAVLEALRKAGFNGTIEPK